MYPVYHTSCDNCDDSYIGETAGSRKSRFIEHGLQKSFKQVNSDQLNHIISLENVRILQLEWKWFERGVSEAIQIWINNTILNSDTGRYNLPSV